MRDANRRGSSTTLRVTNQQVFKRGGSYTSRLAVIAARFIPTLSSAHHPPLRPFRREEEEESRLLEFLLFVYLVSPSSKTIPLAGWLMFLVVVAVAVI